MSRLLKSTSYPITVDGEDIFFTTKFGIQYQIYLTDGAGYSPDLPFAHLVKMVGFRPMDKPPNKGAFKPDQQLRATIVRGIELCFERAPDMILVYVCDMMDGRQRQRSLLFDRWFIEFGDGYQKHAYTDNTYTYCGLLFRNGHPYADELDEAVTDYIRAKAAE